MAKQITIQTPEDISLSYEIAGPGSRIAAGLIDLTIIWSAIAGILILMLSTGAITMSLTNIVDGRLPAEIEIASLLILLGSILFLNIGYFIFFEWTTNGQSIGKRAVGLRVVQDGGQALVMSASIIRNIGRVVDFLPGPYIVGLVSSLVSSKGQRIGDFIAGTVVIRHEHPSIPKRPFPGISYSSSANAQYRFDYDQLVNLGAEGYQILDAYFQRRDQLDRQQRAQLELGLAEDFQKRTEFAQVNIKEPNTFLKELYLALREHLEV